MLVLSLFIVMMSVGVVSAADTMWGRESTICENSRAMDNYFEIDTLGTQEIMEIDPSEIDSGLDLEEFFKFRDKLNLPEGNEIRFEGMVSAETPPVLDWSYFVVYNDPDAGGDYYNSFRIIVSDGDTQRTIVPTDIVAWREDRGIEIETEEGEFFFPQSSTSFKTDNLDVTLHRIGGYPSYPVTNFFKGNDYNSITYGSKTAFSPVCTPAMFFRWELSEIWVLRFKQINDASVMSVDSALDNPEYYGMYLPEGSRSEQPHETPIGVEEYISLSGDSYPTSMSPNVRDIRDGSYRFDYIVEMLGQKSSGEYETEKRLVSIYLFKNSVDPYAPNTEEYKEELKDEVDRTIGFVGTISESAGSHSFSPPTTITHLTKKPIEIEETPESQVGPASWQCPDLNGDGIVDGTDLGIVNMNFGYQEGETQFDSRVDLNHDKIINIRDITIVSTSIGKSIDEIPECGGSGTSARVAIAGSAREEPVAYDPGRASTPEKAGFMSRIARTLGFFILGE